MSAETIIANLQTDFGEMSTEAQAFILSLTGRVTALESTVAALGAPAAAALTDAGTAIEGALSVGAAAAVAATNPTTAAIAIGAAAAPISAAFVSLFNIAKGFLEGITGQTPAAGASTAETDGDAAGVATKNLWDALKDSIKETI